MKIKIPFVLSAGQDDSFKLYNSDQLKLDSELKNMSIISIFDSLLFKKPEQEKVELRKKSDYMKGSESKMYYEQLNKKK